MKTLEDVFEAIESSSEHRWMATDEDSRQAITAYWDNQPGYWETCDSLEFLESYDEAFAGIWNDEADFASNLVDDLGVIGNADSFASQYFDYDAFERALFMGEYWSSNLSSGVVVVFRII